MWFVAMSASNKFAAYSRGSATSRTANSKYFLRREVSHRGDMMTHIGMPKMVNFEQLSKTEDFQLSTFERVSGPNRKTNPQSAEDHKGDPGRQQMSGCRNHQNYSDQQGHIGPLDAIFGGHDACPLVLIPSPITWLQWFALSVPPANQPRFTKKRIAMTITASITAISTIFAKVMFSTSLAYSGSIRSVSWLCLHSA